MAQFTGTPRMRTIIGWIMVLSALVLLISLLAVRGAQGAGLGIALGLAGLFGGGLVLFGAMRYDYLARRERQRQAEEDPSAKPSDGPPSRAS
ncbi:MAG TPA: hypothetical protein VM695_10245 [Phycisphaerae bacterium]|nr:hypothetical protein [Phycisphaerae bacterium]